MGIVSDFLRQYTSQGLIKSLLAKARGDRVAGSKYYDRVEYINKRGEKKYRYRYGPVKGAGRAQHNDAQIGMDVGGPSQQRMDVPHGGAIHPNPKQPALTLRNSPKGTQTTMLDAVSLPQMTMDMNPKEQPVVQQSPKPQSPEQENSTPIRYIPNLTGMLSVSEKLGDSEIPTFLGQVRRDARISGESVVNSLKPWSKNDNHRVYVKTTTGHEGVLYLSSSRANPAGKIEGNLTAREWNEVLFRGIRGDLWIPLNDVEKPVPIKPEPTISGKKGIQARLKNVANTLKETMATIQAINDVQNIADLYPRATVITSFRAFIAVESAYLEQRRVVRDLADQWDADNPNDLVDRSEFPKPTEGLARALPPQYRAAAEKFADYILSTFPVKYPSAEKESARVVGFTNIRPVNVADALVRTWSYAPMEQDVNWLNLVARGSGGGGPIIIKEYQSFLKATQS